VAAMIVLAVVAVAGLGVSFLLPVNPLPSADREAGPRAATGALDAAV